MLSAIVVRGMCRYEGPIHVSQEWMIGVCCVDGSRVVEEKIFMTDGPSTLPMHIMYDGRAP